MSNKKWSSVKGKPKKHSEGYKLLIERVKYIDKPPFPTGISASGIDTSKKDVQRYMKEHDLVEYGGSIKHKSSLKHLYG